MRALKDILMVILLCVLVALTCTQEGDVLDLKRRTAMNSGGLVSLYGGLDSGGGGLALPYLRSASAQIEVVGLDAWGVPNTVWGTGVFVSDNVLVTAKHVLNSRRKLSDVTIWNDGVTYAAIEILEDSDDDLALVMIEGRTGPTLRIGPPPPLGDNLVCIGSPIDRRNQDMKYLTISWAHVSSENYTGGKFVYDGFAYGGCSGGPVISRGRLVGVVVQKLRGQCGQGFAVKLHRLDPELMARIQ